MKWLLFYLMAGQPMATSGPFADKAGCEYVGAQIKKAFKPKAMACITLKPDDPISQP